MAEPVSTALGVAAKKIIVDAISDPEKFLKFLGYIFLGILAIVLLLILPVIIIISMPAVFFSFWLGPEQAPEIMEQQREILAIYEQAPGRLNDDALEWVEDQKADYSWCDQIRVNYSFNLKWQDIISIDAILLEQDFNNASLKGALNIGNRFIQQSARTEKYKAKKYYYVDVENEDGTTSRKRKSKTVTKTRAIISVSTKSFSEVIRSYGFDEKSIVIGENIYKTIENYDIEGALNNYEDIDLSDLKEYPAGSANLPYFNQTDVRWGASPYGLKGTIASSGCGPTSLAMVVSGLTNRNINPQIVSDWSYKNGYRAEGNGSYWSLMTDGGRHYGLKVEQVSRKNPQRIVEALSQGHPIIVSMGRGHFTNGGHYIVLRGITEDGKILVHDSYSVKRSKKAWDLGIIMNESSTNGGVNGSPFWIFSR